MRKNEEVFMRDIWALFQKKVYSKEIFSQKVFERNQTFFDFFTCFFFVILHYVMLWNMYIDNIVTKII